LIPATDRPEVTGGRPLHAARARIEWERHDAASSLQAASAAAPRLLESVKRNKVALKGP
jgi:hypothetical protein